MEYRNQCQYQNQQEEQSITWPRDKVIELTG